MTRTFLLLCLNRVFFLSDRLTRALQAWKDMFSEFDLGILFDGSLNSALLTPYVAILSCGGLLVVLLISIFQEKGVSIRDYINAKPVALRWAIMLVCVLVVLLFGRYTFGVKENFMYARF